MPSGSGFGQVGQAFFHVAHAVVTEVADQASIETWQAGHGGHLVARLELLDESQRVGAIEALGFHAIDADPHLMVVDPQHRAARQADDRIAPPFLAALHRLQQVGVRRVGQLQVDRQRRVEVGKGLEGQRDAVVAIGGQPQEFFAIHDQPHRRRERSTECKRAPAIRRRMMSGAPAPTRQGLDDLHPEFADRHGLISLVGGGKESSGNTISAAWSAQGSRSRRLSMTRVGASSAIGRPWL